jgi:hypothetical protein
MKKRKTRYDLSGRECGEGWSGIVQPLFDDLMRLGGDVRQIKEKFGGLRFYYSLPPTVSSDQREAFARRVRRAEEASFKICETCGKPGRLVNDRGYLFTACHTCHEARRKLPP